MTPKERMGAFLTGEAIDRVPVIPLILNHATRVAGMTVKEHASDGAKMGQAHVAAYRLYGQDMITIFTNTAVLSEAMGTKLYHPEDDAARVDVPIVESHDDVDNVIDADPREDNAMRVHLDAVAHCAKEVGDEVFTSCCFAAPFTPPTSSPTLRHTPWASGAKRRTSITMEWADRIFAPLATFTRTRTMTTS